MLVEPLSHQPFQGNQHVLASKENTPQRLSVVLPESLQIEEWQSK